MRLLDILADAVLPPRETDALVRRMHADALLTRLEPVVSGSGQRAVTSLFAYDDPAVQACILETKFEGNKRAAEFLGRALREFLIEFLAETAPFDPAPPIIVPLPLSAARRAERGYNQVERVLRYAMDGQGAQQLRALADPGALYRTRETRPQTSLSGHARRRNVDGAFGAVPCEPHRTYIVVDDVITTGNTMLAACEALEAAGATRLLPLTLAH